MRAIYRLGLICWCGMSCQRDFTKPLRQTMRWCSKIWAAMAKQLCQFSNRRLAVNDQRTQHAKLLCHFAKLLCQISDLLCHIGDRRV